MVKNGNESLCATHDNFGKNKLAIQTVLCFCKKESENRFVHIP